MALGKGNQILNELVSYYREEYGLGEKTALQLVSRVASDRLRQKKIQGCECAKWEHHSGRCNGPQCHCH